MVQALGEWLFLTESARRARTLPPAELAAARRAARLAAQRAHAANVLWTARAHAAALGLAVRAWDDAEQALELLPQMNPAPQGETLTAEERKTRSEASLKLSKRELAVLAAARQARTGPLPELDREVGDEGARRYRAIARGADLVAVRIAARAPERREVLLRRVLRVVVVLAIVVLPAAWYVYSTQPRTTIEASSEFSGDFPAADVFDGNLETEWLLAERSSGVVSIELSPPRDISGIRLTNANNAPYFDRGARRCVVELFDAQDHVLTSARHEFATQEQTRVPVDIPITARGVRKVRVRILSFHGLGGGLAEIELR